jgi:hypothetical protein
MTPRGALSFIASVDLLAGCGRVDFEARLAPPSDGAADVASDATSDAPLANIAWVREAPLAQTDETAGDPYTLAMNVQTSATGCDSVGSSATAIYISGAIAATHSPFTVTIQPLGGNPQELALYVAEYTGVTTLDQSVSLLTPAAASPMTFSSGTTPMTTAADELLISVGTSCAGNPGTVALASTSGFMIRASEDTTNTRQPGAAADKVVSARGMYSADSTATFTAGSQNPAMAVIATLR